MSSGNAEAPLDPAALAEKARKKELHRKSMIWTGALIALSALAAGWIGFGPVELLPRFGAKRAAPEPPLRPMLVSWGEVSETTMAAARKKGSLLVMLLTASWSRPCARTDGHTFADPEVADFLDKKVVALRADADDRPDLALRYLLRYPTVALLLPSGQIIDIGPYAYDPKAFLAWAGTLSRKAGERRGAVDEAARKALEKAAVSDSSSFDVGREEALGRLQARLDAGAAGGGASLPRFDLLLALRSVGRPWAEQAAAEREAAALALEDPAGGFFRDREPGQRDAVMRLGDQADALAYLARRRPDAAARLRRFALKDLAERNGGYAAGFSFDATRDARLFCDENGRFAAAVLSDPAATIDDKDAARRALDRFWAARGKDGLAPRRMGSRLSGLLGDQLGLLEGLLAAGREDDAKALAAAVERSLLDPQGEAFLDRPSRGELQPPLDRLRVPALNVRAWLLWKRLKSPRAAKLESWLRRHAEGLNDIGLAAIGTP